MNKVQKVWGEVRSSLWFVPSLMMLMAIVLALALIEADSLIGREALRRWPAMFGASAEGARNILSAIATSMITVAGVTFSITIVALSLASNQFSPRILRNFMRDRSNQVVLGIFISIFIYCLTVLRAIRGGEEAFVPPISILFAILLALVGVAFLIYFIHHIATSIQASTIISTVAKETVGAIAHLFPQELGRGEEEEDDEKKQALEGTRWEVIPSFVTGYIQSVNSDALVIFAADHDIVVRMEKGVGDFAIKDAPLASCAVRTELEPKVVRALNGFYIINSYRTVEQDAGFGIRQIVDIAIKALSPGVNDTTTALICIDYLGSILHCLVSRQIPSRYRYARGELRVIARGPTYERLVNESFHEIRQSAQGNVAVLLRMLDAIEVVAARATGEARRRILWQHVELIHETALQTIKSAHDLAAICDRIAGMSRKIEALSPLGKDRE